MEANYKLLIMTKVLGKKKFVYAMVFQVRNIMKLKDTVAFFCYN
jgi:hypothetical protein